MIARWASAGAASALLAAGAAAQEPGAFRAVGSVRDSAGAPIAGATVSTADARTVTDSLGRFAFRLFRAESTTVTIRRLGFESVTFTMLTDSLALNDLAIQLEPVARQLHGIAVREERIGRVPTLERFDERRRERAGFGLFLTRGDILRREGASLSSLVGQAKGVRLIRLANGRALVRFTRWSHKGGSCAPRVWLDGVVAKGLELDDVPSTDVEALELYPSAVSVPSEFTASEFDCGVVAIWTRRPILGTR